mmetsp:Transcript_27805/g.85294  ORF Transcript_27805/g.85294 Transcript_27805/m.85294 type:complete len:110 (+) Transcript_27805:398-727(+)
MPTRHHRKNTRAPLPADLSRATTSHSVEESPPSSHLDRPPGSPGKGHPSLFLLFVVVVVRDSCPGAAVGASPLSPPSSSYYILSPHPSSSLLLLSSLFFLDGEATRCSS